MIEILSREDGEKEAPEYSRILIEQYCAAKGKRKLARLVELSYDPGLAVTAAAAIKPTCGKQDG